MKKEKETSDIFESDWFLTRPEIIKEAVKAMPPGLYKFKNSGKQCFPISYEEPESGLFEDITVTVAKTGKGGKMAEMGLGLLDNNKVFNCKLEDFEPWAEEE